jgi:hypothetical protein
VPWAGRKRPAVSSISNQSGRGPEESGALQNLRGSSGVWDNAPASWSAAVPCRIFYLLDAWNSVNFVSVAIRRIPI